MLQFLRKCFERDRAILRAIQRSFIYPIYRYEYFKFAEIREKMQAFKYLDKEEMIKEGKWKWVYVIK